MDDMGNRLRDLAISDTGFVFDPHLGTTYSLNASALLILRALQRGATRAEIVKELEEAFAAEDEDLNRDITELIMQLRQNGILAPTFEI